MIVKFQVEFSKSWVIGSVKLCWERGFRCFLEAHSHSSGNAVHTEDSESFSLWKQDQEDWGASAERTVCVNVHLQREHSYAEPLVIGLQIPVCCDLRMLVNSRHCPDSHQPSLCCFSWARGPGQWAVTREGGQRPVERTGGQESRQTRPSWNCPAHAAQRRVNSILMLWSFVLKEGQQ